MITPLQIPVWRACPVSPGRPAEHLYISKITLAAAMPGEAHDKAVAARRSARWKIKRSRFLRVSCPRRRTGADHVPSAFPHNDDNIKQQSEI